MTEENYNGWANRPTWVVNLWLSNDESLYRQTQERVAQIRRDASDDEMVELGTWTVAKAERFRLADNLKDWVTNDLAPDLGASFSADLLGYALGAVDWDEIAAAWIADADE